MGVVTASAECAAHSDSRTPAYAAAEVRASSQRSARHALACSHAGCAGSLTMGAESVCGADICCSMKDTTGAAAETGARAHWGAALAMGVSRSMPVGAWSGAAGLAPSQSLSPATSSATSSGATMRARRSTAGVGAGSLSGLAPASAPAASTSQAARASSRMALAEPGVFFADLADCGENAPAAALAPPRGLSGLRCGATSIAAPGTGTVRTSRELRAPAGRLACGV